MPMPPSRGGSAVRRASPKARRTFSDLVRAQGRAHIRVEATTYDDIVAVRNSTDPAGPMLTVLASGWLAFLDEVLAGRINSAGSQGTAAGPFTVRLAEDGVVELAGQQSDGPVIRFTQLDVGSLRRRRCP